MGIHRLRGLTQFALAMGALIICTAQIPIATPTVEQFDAQTQALEATLPGARSDTSRALAMLPRLDQAEQSFALLSSGPPHRPPRIELYHRLDTVLRSLRDYYRKLSDDCASRRPPDETRGCVDAREVATRSASLLGWLDFAAANSWYLTRVTKDPASSKPLLEEARALFARSAQETTDPDIRRDNLVGRAYAERELGRYDKSQFAHAIDDFKLVMKDGREVKQYKSAQQGCATAYVMMGEIEMRCTGPQSVLPSHGPGYQSAAHLMFEFQMDYAAMYFAKDNSSRAKALDRIIDRARANTNNPPRWALSIAAIAKYSHDPTAELGGSSDPFRNHLLANVLRSKQDRTQAAKYFRIAAASGKYPEDSRFAAELEKNRADSAGVGR